MDTKFEILYTILKDLQDAGVLKHVVLVGSWCQEFYRHHFENSFEIPTTRTMDADILIPRRKNPKKKAKDIDTVKGMFLFFRDKPHHLNRLHQVIDEMPKEWKKRIQKALENTDLSLPL